jgi:hypothetical protein
VRVVVDPKACGVMGGVGAVTIVASMPAPSCSQPNPVQATEQGRLQKAEALAAGAGGGDGGGDGGTRVYTCAGISHTAASWPVPHAVGLYQANLSLGLVL